VEEIGGCVAGVFADTPRLSGKTFKVAGNRMTGQGLQVVLNEAAGHLIPMIGFPTTYSLQTLISRIWQRAWKTPTCRTTRQAGCYKEKLC
jgi:hypothetical protein